MPTPIITLPIHTIEQARALAGLLRAYIDGQQPDTNDGADWKPDPDLAGITALWCHLDAGIAEGKRRDYAANGRDWMPEKPEEMGHAGVSQGHRPGAMTTEAKTAEQVNFDRWQAQLHRQYQRQQAEE